MDKIKIKHIPHCVDAAMVFITILTVCATISLKTLEKPELSDITFSFAVFALFFLGIILCCIVKTTVTFGEGSTVKCRWLFLSRKIDLEHIVSVTYTLDSKMSRGGGRLYFFHLIFYTDKDKFITLKDRLDYLVAEDCIRKKYDNVQLMKLYRYIQTNCPEKAKGYE